MRELREILARARALRAARAPAAVATSTTIRAPGGTNHSPPAQTYTPPLNAGGARVL